MTVKSLIKCLEGMNPDAEVFTSEPYEKDSQENHTAFGARYLVSHGNYIWFERYGDEDIGYEVECIIEEVINGAMSDEDYIDILFDKDEHGYTMEDIRLNCSRDIYQWLHDNEYRKEMYPNV